VMNHCWLDRTPGGSRCHNAIRRHASAKLVSLTIEAYRPTVARENNKSMANAT
jgi:hypothetical protein